MALLALAVASLLASGCGFTASQASPTPGGGTAPAGGDIPDTQVFLRYQGSSFSLEYPEGWQQTAASTSVVFQDKDNRVSATIKGVPAPPLAKVASDLPAGAHVTSPATETRLPSGTAVKISFQVQGQPDPVTGKRPTLAEDRYYIPGSGRHAVLELASPVGVDNVDAYTRIAESFRWG